MASLSAKKTVRHTLRFVRTHLAHITFHATRARLTVPDFLVQSTMLVIEQNLIPAVATRSKPSRKKVNNLLERYFALEADRLFLEDLRRSLILQIRELTPTDPTILKSFSHTHLIYEQLVQDLHVCELALLNPENGYGLLQDVSNLLTDSIKVDTIEVGDDTHFLLVTPKGCATIPLRIIANEIWLGGLPDHSVVYVNNRRLGL